VPFNAMICSFCKWGPQSSLILSKNHTINILKMQVTHYIICNLLLVITFITYPKSGDFLIDNDLLFEVGGQNKTREQIKGIENSYIAADGILYGFKEIYPLWLFGFLY
jgi:hypothetical protein